MTDKEIFTLIDKDYLKSMNMEYSVENIEDFGLDFSCMRVKHRNSNTVVVLYSISTPSGMYEILHIVSIADDSVITLEI